jgi:hypothetical protein
VASERALAELAAEVAMIRLSQRANQERFNVLELRIKVAEEEIAEQRAKDRKLAERLNEIEKQLGDP